MQILSTPFIGTDDDNVDPLNSAWMTTLLHCHQCYGGSWECWCCSFYLSCFCGRSNCCTHFHSLRNQNATFRLQLSDFCHISSLPHIHCIYIITYIYMDHYVHTLSAGTITAAAAAVQEMEKSKNTFIKVTQTHPASWASALSIQSYQWSPVPS